MAADNSKITALINTMKSTFLKASDKVTSLATDYKEDNDKIATAGAVQTYVETEIADKADKNEIPTKTSDLTHDSGFALDNTLSTVAKSGSYNDLTNKPAIPSQTSDLTNDGDGSKPFLTEHQDISGKANIADLATVATSGSYDDLTDKPEIPGVVTVEQQSTADSGYSATYIVKQGGSQVGSKINIPKDFLVKSGSVKVAKSSDLSTLGSEYAAGDKYIDFVINTKDGSESDAHMYINVKDLVEDTTYEADEVTLTLSNGTFSVKAGSIGATQLSSDINTILGYATAYHNNTVLQGITAQDITNWNAKSELTQNDIDTTVNSVIDAINNGLSA